MKNIKIILLFVLCVYEVALGQKSTRLPDPINLKDYIEYAPSISADGRILIYQSGRYGLYVNAGKRVPVINAEGRTQKIENGEMTDFYGVYETTLHPSGQWLKPEPIMNINSFGEGLVPVIGGPSISYDGNFLYFFANYNDDAIGYGREDIYYCARTKYGWSKPINIGDEINSPGYEGFPSISPDGKVLYFVRENLAKLADGDERCYRIMRSNLGSNGKWQRPIELPAPVNMDCEKAPRIMADGKTLVYSSIKKGGKGDFDLYYSRFQDNGNWSAPVALDMINTKKSDQSVAISACGDILYYISNGDIYTYAIPEALRPYKMATIQGFVTEAATGKPIQTRVLLTNATTAQLITSVESNPEDGRFTLLAPVTEAYEVSVNVPQYQSLPQQVTIQDYVGCKLIARDFKLKSNSASNTGARSDIVMMTSPPSKAALEPIQKPSDNKEPVATTAATLAPTAIEAPKPAEPTQQQIATTGDIEFAAKTVQPEIEKLSAENELIAEVKQLEVQDTTKVPSVSQPIAKKIEPDRFHITINVQDVETNSIIPTASVIAWVANKQVLLNRDNQSRIFELDVAPNSSFRIVSSDPTYQSSENVLENITENKNIVVKLLKIRGSIVKIAVFDFDTGKLIPAKITIANNKKETTELDANNGKAESTFDQPGEITITTTAAGYTTVSKSINIEIVPGGKVYDYEARIDKITHSLSMNVVDIETNRPISKATFDVKNLTDNSVLTVTVDANEEIPISGKGKFEITCTAEGYNSHQVVINVAQEKTEVLFKIQKTPKKFIFVAIQVFDKYSTEQLGSKIIPSANAALVEGSLRFEEGQMRDFKVNVNGYSAYSHVLSDEDIAKGSVKVALEKDLYPFAFRALSMTNRAVLANARFAVLDESNNSINLEVDQGIASSMLSPTKKYKVNVTAEGYEGFSQSFDPQVALEAKQDVQELLLKPEPIKIVSQPEPVKTVVTKSFGELKKGATITLNKIYFDQSSPVLRTESFEELDNLVQVLNQNEEIRIEIRGHTDNTGDFDANVKLSRERCESVVKYLTVKGIAKKRLQYVGKGPVNPVAPNNNEENKKKNRRVEFVVL